MITINIRNDETGHIKTTDPQEVEIYVGAMESYEHFDLGGIKWKIPSGMLDDLFAARKIDVSQQLIDAFDDLQEETSNLRLLAMDQAVFAAVREIKGLNEALTEAQKEINELESELESKREAGG